MATSIRFGTDGWRGIIAQDFTFDNVRACAQAVAGYIKDKGMAGRGLVVGYDTRFISEDFAAAVAEVAAGNKIKVYLCPRATPTPVVSYGIMDRKAAGAVIITASHNPAVWNGFKYKPEYAGSASPEVTADLEKRVSEIQSSGNVSRIPLATGLEQGLIQYFDPAPPYLSHIAGLVDLESIRQSQLKVVVDPMYGAGMGYFKAILGGGNIEVIEINSERNPLFPGIQPEPIALNLGKLSRTVCELGAGVGLATDGDADRVGIVDEKGTFITPLQVFALLALYLLEVRGERGPIIKSITSTSMLYRLGALFSVPVYEMPIGFKYIGPKMLQTNALIGGEESGGFGFRGHIPERDGILSALYFLDLMLKLNRSPSGLVADLFAKVGPHYYERIDIPFPSGEWGVVADRLGQAKVGQIDGTMVAGFNTLDGFRFKLSDESWIHIRFSGTESVIRIYVESDSPERVERLLAAARRLAGV